MNQATNVVRGTVLPDGTLKLAEPLGLTPCEVEVTVRPVGEVTNQFLPRNPAKETLWEYMERTRAELEASGHQFRTKEEIDADIEDMRNWDGKVEAVYRQIEEEQRRGDR